MNPVVESGMSLLFWGGRKKKLSPMLNFEWTNFHKPAAACSELLCTYLEAVLIRHDLLGFPLVDGLCRAPRGLCGHGPSGCAVGTLWEVEVRYLDADLIAHDVLELDGESELCSRKKITTWQWLEVIWKGNKQELTCRTMLWMSLSIVKAIYAWMVNISLSESSYWEASMFPSSKFLTISKKAE